MFLLHVHTYEHPLLIHILHEDLYAVKSKNALCMQNALNGASASYFEQQLKLQPPQQGGGYSVSAAEVSQAQRSRRQRFCFVDLASWAFP